VSTNVTFQVTRLPGVVVAYDFAPHGIRFAVPLQVEQPTAGTTFHQLSSTGGVQGAYFLDNSQVSQSTGSATVNEFRPTSVASDRSAIRFTVDHFSGYLVSTGRQ
jgi:hypothetical protein